jgi:hypothetical protein
MLVGIPELYYQPESWIEFLDGWKEHTKGAMWLPWADGVTRSTRLFIQFHWHCDIFMGDQQEGDKYTGELCLYHGWFVQHRKYFDTADFEVKTM